ncbi:MAG: VCBS repeat-containing protein [Candidatus Nealsonbacteria bacterium]|nr:VCBS repeat-containing protein [Candidatus Nealsonbacteria bacterium]
MQRRTRARRTIRLSCSLLVAMVWATNLSTARALINPHYTPVDLYYQSPAILRVQIAGPNDRAEMAVTVVKAIKGTWSEKRSLRADMTDEQLAKNLKAALGGRKKVPALLFSGDFSGAAMDNGDNDTPLGMLQVGTRWFALKDGGGHHLLSRDPLDMHTVWAGSDEMLQRVMEYVAADVRADVPTKVGVAWGGQLKLADVNGKVNGCMAVDVFDDGRPCLFVSAESGDRLFRSDDGGTFDDVADEIGLDTKSTHAVWGDFNADGRLDLASCRERRLSIRLMGTDGKLAAAGDDVELPGACVGLSLFAVADGKRAGLVAATAETPVLVTTDDNGKLSWRACRIPTEAGQGQGGPCVVADFGGDAVADILQPRSNGLLFFKGSASGTYSLATVACDFRLGDAPIVSICGDYDADGLLDLLVVGKSGCRTFVNLGDGKFRDALFEAGEVQYNATGADVVAGANCDVNNDGRQDFMLFCADTWPRPFFNRGFRCFGFAVELDPQRCDLQAARATKAGQQAGTMADFNGDGAQDMAVVTAQGEVWLLLRDADQGSRLGVTVALPRDTPGPITVSGTDGKRSLGTRLVPPGSTVLFGKRNKGPIKLQWKRQSGTQETAQVIVIRPTRFTLTHQEPSQ